MIAVGDLSDIREDENGDSRNWSQPGNKKLHGYKKLHGWELDRESGRFTPREQRDCKP